MNETKRQVKRSNGGRKRWKVAEERDPKESALKKLKADDSRPPWGKGAYVGNRKKMARRAFQENPGHVLLAIAWIPHKSQTVVFHLWPHILSEISATYCKKAFRMAWEPQKGSERLPQRLAKVQTCL